MCIQITMVKLMDNTVIHEVYSSVKQAFFTVLCKSGSGLHWLGRVS